MEEKANLQLFQLESENVHLRAAIKKATIQLELLENNSELLIESNALKQQYEEMLKKLCHLECEKGDLLKLLQEEKVECTRKITALETMLVECRAKPRTKERHTVMDECITDCQPKVRIDKCVGDCKTTCERGTHPAVESRLRAVFGDNETWCDCKSDSGMSLKAEEVKLEEVVHELQSSVSKMIVSECQMKQDRARIAALESEVTCAWKARDKEVAEARSCREQEIINLQKVIGNLMKNLDNEKQRSDNLQKAVDVYHETVDTVKESENKFKQEVLGQKRTIQNLQEALIKTKQNLEDLQQKSNIECEEHSCLVNKLIAIVTTAEKEIQIYVQQCEQFAILVEKLRDENVQLEENLFYNHQDLEMYEMRLSKYQTLYNQVEAQCGELRKELQVLELQKNEKDLFVQDLSDNLAECQKELLHLFTILNEEKIGKEDQTEEIAQMQSQLGLVSHQLECTLSELEREKERNVKLSKSLMKTKNATCAIRNEAMLAHEKLQAAALKMADDDQKIHALSTQIADYQSIIGTLEQEQCRLKEQLVLVEQQVNNSCTDCAGFNEQLVSQQQQHEATIMTFQNTISTMSDKLYNAEIVCRNHCKELEMELQHVTELEHNESKLKQDLLEKETLYNTQINQYHSEQERLITVVNNLELQITHIGSQLMEKERALEMLRSSVCGQQELRDKQEEIVHLKNEINTLIQTQMMLKTDNDKMQLQMAHMRAALAANDEKHQLIISELEACLNDLHNDKDFLVRKNDQLMTKMQTLQELCNTKSESLIALELELSEAKCTRDSLCNESKQVIDHVKCWLEEQRRLNVELNQRLKHKNDVIAKLKQEKKHLSMRVKQCATCHAVASKTSTCVQPQHQQYSMQVLHSPPPPRHGWSLGSVDSAPCSFVDDSDWEADNSDEHCPQMWIHRVETLTEELQRSNHYWKGKMADQDFPVSRDK